MFSSGANYNKLKTNLRLCINRLKLLEKKKTELALKQRKEIADYLAAGKIERAKIRVEHIIREDYLVEAMEVLEMYCDLLLARFGLIQQMKELDDGLAEAISSIIWVAPRLQSDVQELRVVADQLGFKYGKPYAAACRENGVGTVSEKLMHKMSVQAPPKITVEKYLIEIAKYYNVEYRPDPQVLQADEAFAADNLIDIGPAPPLPDKNELFGLTGPAPAPPPNPQQAVPGAAGGGHVPFNYPPYPTHPAPSSPFVYPGAPINNGLDAAGASASQFGHHPMTVGSTSAPPAMMTEDVPPPYFPPDANFQQPPPGLPSAPVPTPRTTGPALHSSADKQQEEAKGKNNQLGLPSLPADLPELPGVPTDAPAGAGNGAYDYDDDDEDKKKGGDEDDEEIDFDELTRRFEALKRVK